MACILLNIHAVCSEDVFLIVMYFHELKKMQGELFKRKHAKNIESYCELGLPTACLTAMNSRACMYLYKCLSFCSLDEPGLKTVYVRVNSVWELLSNVCSKLHWEIKIEW